ncbi:4Fe-4S ferredoxin [Shewanella sp. Choline-02u-19]|jgi:polyferredoxin|uniref:4Fe-4S binding protein n=1 Tax=unclassified Shewanella TaxID=196818 RepID=UPI000C31D893|nr:MULTISPECIES: 4Fe-4S binding protein [unclassified Shewanella]PKG55475.1 4Fe-4S ferredoxin [Shewanella sp. GutDb-MelDb]PKG75373.1 4Fe-4S ferredoxin [Shewanella sp. GutCb]PKH59346.1 4Fe-4S ferredoxin [Shewanella sp. Bg11-22]PKI29232.1 4Fe-4S ferredoxin [Shewanella sp. Choline-02u-19]
MSFIESLTLTLALTYSVSLLYWSGKKWGAAASGVLVSAAVISSLYWPLIAALAIAAVIIGLVSKFQPQVAQGDMRSNNLREGVQHLLALSMLLVGIQFAVNSALLKAGITPWLMRPDVGDAFLPIAGGIELKAIISLGIWDQTHPAAAVMLTVVLLTGLICKRAFCGWACPLGLAGEYLYKLRIRFIKREYLPPAWLDWPLRMVKYLLLLALLYIIVGMPAQGIPDYLSGNYHKIADLKMALFFITPGLVTFLCFSFILSLALWRRQGFCRYICPYGALLGLVSFLSPFKIRRNTQHCLIDSKGMNCDKCSRACPANISVHSQINIRSDECQACMRCVSACPTKEALQFSTRNGIKLSARGLTIALMTLLFLVPLIAYLCGFWVSQTPTETRMYLIQHLNSIGH